jgi:hypothetical protein
LGNHEPNQIEHPPYENPKLKMLQNSKLFEGHPDTQSGKFHT